MLMFNLLPWRAKRKHYKSIFLKCMAIFVVLFITFLFIIWQYLTTKKIENLNQEIKVARAKLREKALVLAAIKKHSNKVSKLKLQESPLLKAIDLREMIISMTQALNMKVVLSPSVQGTTLINSPHSLTKDALDLLLLTNGLAAWSFGSIVLIAPKEELIKRKQEEIKWQEIQLETAFLQKEVWLLRYAKASDIAPLLQNDQNGLLSKRGSLRIDTRTNLIWVQDLPEKIKNIGSLIKQVDRPVQQIAIQARLISIDYDFEQELGVQFAVHTKTDASFENKTGHYSLAVAKLADGSLLDVKLAALEKRGHAELISSPSLFTANQQPASIEAGEEVPYQEVSESGGTAVVFKKAVLGLNVTPQILPGQKVMLQLQINQDRPSNKMVLGMPTISTRQIMTNVLVKNGQTLVLGGIYETNKEKGEQGLPFLNRLPVINRLFKQQNRRLNKRELLIFITPEILPL